MLNTTKIYFLILLVLLSIAGCTNNPVFEPQKHQIKTTTKWLVSNKTNDKIAKISYKKYNRTGKLVFSEKYNEKNVLLIRRVITYTKTLKIETITEFKTNTESIKSKNIFRFDSNGNISERVSINTDGDTTSVFKFFYDSKGHIIKELHYDNKGNLINKISYTYNYNIDGFVTRRIVRDFDNKPTSRDSIIYKPDEQQVKRIVYYTESNKQIIYTYIYDNAGNVRKEILTDHSGNILKKYIYEYTYY